MTCTITGLAQDGSGAPLAGLPLRIEPAEDVQVSLLLSDGTYATLVPPWPSDVSASDGTWSIDVYSPSVIRPEALAWRLWIGDASFIGTVPDVTTIPFSELVGARGWKPG